LKAAFFLLNLRKPIPMKKFMNLFISLLIMLWYPAFGYGQKMMIIDEDLKANSYPLEAKRKGVGVVGKYEFGPYKTIEGKVGWFAGFGMDHLFNYCSESKSKASFTMIAYGQDSIRVNISRNTKTCGATIGNVSWESILGENYMDVISMPDDSADWVMVLVTRSEEGKDEESVAQGLLTNGIVKIDIMEVRKWEDGKTPAFGMACGYQYYLGGQTIAAVQSSIDTTKKKFVWLSMDLDEKLKSVLAAAMVSLMVHADETNAGK
jgi:hypothetical protein